MIVHKFININRLFVQSFKGGENDPTGKSFKYYIFKVKYYIPLLKIKDFNVLINNKPFFDQFIKNKQEAYEKFVETSRSDDYIPRNLLDYLYHSKLH